VRARRIRGNLGETYWQRREEASRESREAEEDWLRV